MLQVGIVVQINGQHKLQNFCPNFKFLHFFGKSKKIVLTELRQFTQITGVSGRTPSPLSKIWFLTRGWGSGSGSQILAVFQASKMLIFPCKIRILGPQNTKNFRLRRAVLYCKICILDLKMSKFSACGGPFPLVNR